ncbi:C-X-C motif chemokine 9 [Arvicola amphibius]|uniref:C-X-C motif chemokine 9 n=1 Tax=Arvicola amphibius TaxID=1047088 RepID=UPI0018E33E00|nr:C-X-C motif chemokine 9 [Arvicola amphibius]
MRSIALFLLGVIFLDQCGVQGALVIRNQRCSCIRTRKGMIPSYRSLRDLKQFAPSPQCNKTEIIATLKTGTQTCLNPDSVNVKKLMQDWEKQISQKKKQKRGKKNIKVQENRKS